MRTLTLALVATVACSSGGKQPPRAKDRPAPPTVPIDAATAPPTVLDAAPTAAIDAAPAPAPVATPGLTPAARTNLGIDGPDAPAAVAPEATARFAVVTVRRAKRGRVAGRTLTIQAIAGGQVTVEATAVLPATDAARVRALAWRDAATLIVLLGDGSLRTFAAGKLEPLARPDPHLFDVAQPDPAAVHRDRDEDLIATSTGEVWLARCKWGAATDHECSAAAYVRVLPTVQAGTTAPTARAAPWLMPAPDWSLATEPLPDHPTGALACGAPDGSTVRVDAPAGTFGFSADATWLSNRPPIRALRTWSAGAAPDRPRESVRLLAGCRLAELAPPAYAIGPGGFWSLTLAGDRAGAANALVLWHGHAVVDVEDVERFAFAP